MQIDDIRLTKMDASLEEGRVLYSLPTPTGRLCVSEWIGQHIALHWHGYLTCTACQRRTKRSFNQGYCYPCFQALAACDRCIMSPHLCHYHHGTCREPAWGLAHCLGQAHVVYLSQTSHIKVGITRAHTQLTRWIDQGAVAAIPVAYARDRRMAGLLEHACTAHYRDRTHWQAMLKETPRPKDLNEAREALHERMQDALAGICATHGNDALHWVDFPQVNIAYPLEQHPTKVKALSHDKQPIIEGVLQGIKGQYLVLDHGVYNLRKHTGYHVALRVLAA